MKHLIFWIATVLSIVLLGACVPAATPAPVENYGVNQNPAQLPEKPTQLPIVETPTQPELQPTAETPIADFSLDKVNKTPPGDVLEEIAYFGTGGDVSCEPNSPQSIFGSKTAEVFGKVLVHSCGWKTNEQISVLIREPNGDTENYSITAKALFDGQSEPTIRFYIYPSQEGNYQITLTGTSGELSQTTQVTKPKAPRMYMVKEHQIVFYNSVPKEQELVFYNLRPSEAISLYAYYPDSATGKVKFVGWEKYQADLNGNLGVNIDDSSLFYYASGETSGYLVDGNLIGVGIQGTIFK